MQVLTILTPVTVITVWRDAWNIRNEQQIALVRMRYISCVDSGGCIHKGKSCGGAGTEPERNRGAACAEPNLFAAGHAQDAFLRQRTIYGVAIKRSGQSSPVRLISGAMAV